MSRFVIAAYRPRPGRAQDLLALVRDHLPVLRREGLATDRPSYVMRAADGTLIEVFEWTSAHAIENAHQNQAVQALWARFGEACDYVSLASLSESQGPFAHFEPVAF
jgi:predicted membrane GTPase involved in stress response